MFDLALALNTAADILILVAFVSMVIFTASYTFFFRWRKTRAGRAILYVFSALLGVTVLSLLGRWIGPDYWMREWFRIIGWFIAVISVLNLLRVLWWNFVRNVSPMTLEPRTQPTPLVDSDQEGDEK